MGQISLPWDYGAFPEVEIISPEKLFDCDVFVFVASRGIPPVGSQVKDVRMAQFENNAAIVKQYARMARAADFQGLWCAVSDPVDPLAKTAYLESNRDENGNWDGKGLRPEQVQGFGLGVMNARAAYFAKRDSRFASFLTEGRSFGPHGTGLTIANSIDHYDEEVSRELTHRTVTANLVMREIGFKPYVAPALSSGALSLLLTLRGDVALRLRVSGRGVYGGEEPLHPCRDRDGATAPDPRSPLRPYPGGGGAFKVGIIEGKPVRTRFGAPASEWNNLPCMTKGVSHERKKFWPTASAGLSVSVHFWCFSAVLASPSIISPQGGSLAAGILC